MKKISLLIFILFTSFIAALGSHIVGGEIELAQLRGNTYQIRLKMYVDVLNANPGVIDQEIRLGARVGVYNKTTNQLMADLTLPKQAYVNVNYGQFCNQKINIPVKTALIIFYDKIELHPSIYNNPGGYYISYQNCCRNIVIKNITNPDEEGMTFYMEFPPVGTINNSPQFPQLVGNYPCLNKPFSMDFSGTDKEKDSLVYKLARPLAGYGDAYSNTNPLSSGPYPPINWETGYNDLTQIKGTPPFVINLHTGEITFTPTELGLFVFSIIAEEYRNGVKIGMVQRDFQFPVVQCDDNAPNTIDLKFPDNSFYDSLTDTLFLSVENDTCFSILLYDGNPTAYNKSENLSVSIIKNTLPSGIVTNPSGGSVTPTNTSITSNLCFDACRKLPITQDSLFYLSLVVTDAPKCPISLAHTDTLNLVIVYQPQINAMPIIGTVPVTTILNGTIGKTIVFDVYGEDDDVNDLITLTGQGEGFSMEEKGMVFTNKTGNDSIGSQFRWTPTCEDLKSGANLKLLFSVADNSCFNDHTIRQEVEIVLQDTATSITTISPSNLFTPNGDGLNDYFTIPAMPDGNCDFFFKTITIYNRWGSKVFESTTTDFKWGGDKHPSGLYFFRIDLNEKEFKGWVEIIR